MSKSFNNSDLQEIEKYSAKWFLIEEERKASHSKISRNTSSYSIAEAYWITEGLLVSKDVSELLFQVCQGRLSKDAFWGQLSFIIKREHFNYSKKLQASRRLK